MLKITRIVHATVLLETETTRVLLDPWFTEHGSWRRSEPLGLAPSELPALTAIVSSHGHPDHFDLGCLLPQAAHVPVLLRKGTGAAARRHGFHQVTELLPWEWAEPQSGLRITATPARHLGPENTYVIQMDGFTIFFGGDSRLIPAYTEVAHRFGPIDVAFLPINGVRLFGLRTVMNPQEAVEACRILRPRVAVPIHYGLAAGWKSGWMLNQPGTPAAFGALMSTSGLSTEVVVMQTGVQGAQMVHNARR